MYPVRLGRPVVHGDFLAPSRYEPLDREQCLVANSMSDLVGVVSSLALGALVACHHKGASDPARPKATLVGLAEKRHEEDVRSQLEGKIVAIDGRRAKLRPGKSIKLDSGCHTSKRGSATTEARDRRAMPAVCARLRVVQYNHPLQIRPQALRNPDATRQALRAQRSHRRKHGFGVLRRGRCRTRDDSEVSTSGSGNQDMCNVNSVGRVEISPWRALGLSEICIQ